MRAPSRLHAPAALPLVAAAILALAIAAPAAAQMDCEPPDPAKQNAILPICNLPPTVWLAPSTAQVSQPSVPVTINAGDHYSGGMESSFRIYLDGQDVTSQWSVVKATSYWGTTGYRFDYTALGTVPLTTQSPVRTVMTRLCDVDECQEQSATYTLSLPGVSVTPDGSSTSVAGGPGVQAQAAFSVVNQGTTTATFTLSPTCRDAMTWAAVSPCSVSPTSQMLAPGAAGGAMVTFGAATVGQVVQIQVEAQQQGSPGVRDSGWRTVTVTGTGSVQRAPVVGTVDLNSAAMMDRGQCVTVAVGPGAAYECGNLRAAHPLPAHRTRGRTWAPVLLYNSEHANPRPTVYADVTLPADGVVPTEVRATVTLANGTSHTRTFAGAGWQPGTTRRIGVQWDGISMATQVHGYSLQVTNVYNGVHQAAAAIPGELVVVNRSASRFGTGWWLAGWEQIACVECGSGPTRMLWVGGDGSTRVYQPVVGQSNRWTALHPDRDADTLVLTHPAGVARFTRRIRGGGEIHFNSNGRQVRTVNRLGQVTEFQIDTYGRLVGIVPPGGGPGLQWTLGYVDYDLLATVSAGPGRSVTLVHGLGGRRVTSMIDPDGLGTSFSYTDAVGTARITDRYAKDGTRVQFTYGIPAGKLTQARTHMQGTAAHGDIVSTFQAAEAKGVATSTATTASVALADAYTLMDGPRTDVDDRTDIWVGRFGAPVRVRDAAGGETRIVRGDARFPALATMVTDPAGLVTTAAYDFRGRVDSTAVVSPLGTSQNQVTKYAWDNTWDKPTSVSTFAVAPGVSHTALVAPSTMAYDAANGNVLWQQQAGDTTRFTYYTSGPATGQLREVVSPRDQNGVAARDSLWYDAMGNLRKTRSPLGAMTFVHRDALGRVTLTVTPTAAATAGDSAALHGAAGAKHWVWYDVMDRDTMTRTVGPPVTHAQYGGFVPQASAEQSLWTRTTLDVLGRPLTVRRWSDPDPANIAQTSNSFTYDRAGRVLTETDPGGEKRFTYDPSGNVIVSRTPRGHEIAMRYDALGRLVQRTVPSVTYAPSTTGMTLGYSQLPFPVFPSDAQNRLVIPEEFSFYRYDAAGRMVHAENGDAIVRRSYHPGGALKGDTLRIRDYAGLGHQHTYGLVHHYDLAGRQTGLTHPSLAGSQNLDQWTYHATTGRLVAATERSGAAFSFNYDRLGRVTRTTMPGSVSDSVRYDLEGRQVWRHEWGPNATLHSQVMEYDARGKLTLVNDQGHGYRQWYSGLGNLVGTNWDNPSSVDELREEFRTDALGNVVATRTSRLGWDPQGVDYPWMRTLYQFGTGRAMDVAKVPPAIPSSDFHQDSTTRGYDLSGNADRSWRLVGGYFASGTNIAQTVESRSYYGADERLRVFQQWDVRQTGSYMGIIYTNRAGVWEEYRYDPLGRRVLVRKRTDGGLCDVDSDWTCLPSVTRFVWSGDQLLWELRNTTGSLESGGQTVSYFHVGGIDRPMLIAKGSERIVPHQNWRGLFSAGTYAGGPNVGQKSDCPPGQHTSCIKIDWPGWATTAWHQKTSTDIRTWYGSLVNGMRDASGQVYMRNRNYDPQTGQFTQPHPIGVARGGGCETCRPAPRILARPAPRPVGAQSSAMLPTPASPRRSCTRRPPPSTR